MFRLAMVALVCAPCPLAAQTASTISGKITDSLTRQPIPKVHVSCTVGSQFVGALTAVDGAYALENVPPGAVRMLINLDGYRLIDERTQASAAFSIAAGDAVRRDFEMHPLGRIFGTLLDRDTGRPIEGRPVFAVRKEYYPGHVAHAATAAEMKGGEFQVKNLAPGDYVLQIDATGEAAIVFPPEASPPDKAPPGKYYGQRWYPDVPRIEMAAAIHLGEGESRRLDISIQSHETHTLSGTVRSPREFEHTPVTVGLRSANVVGDGKHEMREPGAFRIENLTPGAYRVAFTAGKPPNQVAADYEFEIARRDIEDVKVELAPGASVRGEIRMSEEDAKAGAKLPSRPGIVFMVPTSGWAAVLKGGGLMMGGDMPVFGELATGGKFRQESIRPGEYWPVLLDLPEGYALAQTMFEGASAGTTTIHLSAPDTPVNFVLTSRPGAVAGTVRDASQNAVRGASVGLLPDPMPDKVAPGAIRIEHAGDDGAFVFRNVAPGRYRAVVLTGPDGEESDVEHLRELAARAEAFELRAGLSATISLKR
jgi:hypothetical protein